MQRPKRRTVIIAGIVLAAALIGVGLAINRNGQDEDGPQTPADTPQVVEVRAVSELGQNAVLTRTALLMPNDESPIIARAGGRITQLNARVGDPAIAGAVIGKLDGDNEPNPLAAQTASAASVASLFNLIEQQSLVSADNAVALARQGLAAAQAGQTIGLDIQRTSIDITSTSLDQALLSARNAEDTDIEAAIDAADIGVEAAKLARDLAVAQAELQNRGATDALASATLGVRTAEGARERTRAELASQRAQLSGQLATLQEQLRFQEITTASNGTITNLSVTVGDFVSPNQQVGTVAAANTGRLELDVPGIIATSLVSGDTVPARVAGREFVARVEAVSDVANGTGLFPVVLVIDAGIPADAYGTQAEVQFAPTPNGTNFLVPLDAIAVRSDGQTVFTLGSDNTALPHRVTVLNYFGSFAQIEAALAPTDHLIITNTRLLQDGSPVELTN